MFWNYVWIYVVYYTFSVFIMINIIITTTQSSSSSSPIKITRNKSMIYHTIFISIALFMIWCDLMHYCLNKLYHMPLYTVLMYAWLYKCMCVWINMYVWNVWYLCMVYICMFVLSFPPYNSHVNDAILLHDVAIVMWCITAWIRYSFITCHYIQFLRILCIYECSII